MAKVIVLMIIVNVLFMIENRKANKGKEHPKYRNILYVLHIILGILLCVLGTVHGIDCLKTSSVSGVVTGIFNLLFMYALIITGILGDKGKEGQRRKCKRLHKIFAVLLVASVVCHAVALIFFK